MIDIVNFDGAFHRCAITRSISAVSWLFVVGERGGLGLNQIHHVGVSLVTNGESIYFFLVIQKPICSTMVSIVFQYRMNRSIFLLSALRDLSYRFSVNYCFVDKFNPLLMIKPFLLAFFISSNCCASSSTY